MRFLGEGKPDSHLKLGLFPLFEQDARIQKAAERFENARQLPFR